MRARTRGALLGLLTLVALAAPSGAATCSSSVFVEAPAYPVGREPTAVAVADINGDTFPDIVSAGQYPAVVSVLLNDGSGVFGAAIDTGLGGEAYALAAADFDGDGNVDLAVGGSFEVHVLLGLGDGTFEPAVDYPAGGYIQSIGTGSFDAGGTIDLVLAGDSSQIFVLLGAGDGTFGAASSSPAGGATRSIAVGDFDGDGAEDVVAANRQNSTVSLLPGFGDGTFAPPVPFVAGSGPGNILAADLDDDGDLDVAVTSGTYVSVLKGNGSGGFGAARQYPAGNPGPLVAGDFTGDGLVDLAVLGYWDNYSYPGEAVAILAGDGQGGFAATGPAYHSGYAGVAMAAGDFDGDGRPDLAVANAGPTTVTVLLADGAGGFIAARSIATPTRSNTFAEGDYNGDGIPDLAVAGNTTVAVLLGDGHGAFVTSFDQQYSTSTEAVVTGDFTGDGILDLVVLGQYDSMFFLPGLGDGTFGPPAAIPSTYYSRRAAVGDFNGDGKLDLATSHDCCSETSIELLLGYGNGTFQPPSGVYTGFSTLALVARDFDGNGHLDLAATALNGANRVVVLLGVGDGTFLPPSDYATQAGPVSVAAGDLTGDGEIDLITANVDTENLSILPGNGDGTFAAGWTVAVGARPVSVAIGDFDADGISDFVTANESSNTVSLFAGYGGGKFGSPVTYATGRSPVALSIADYDLNGYPDLAVSSGSSSSLTLFSNSRLGIAPLPPAGACLGGAGTLHAFAAGYGPLAYQWRKDGVPLSDGGNVSGATTRTLTIDPAAAENEGDYDVVVTDLCTTATSNATPFTVSVPPGEPVITIDAPPAPGVAGTASVPATAGHAYVWSIGGDAGAFIASGQGTPQISFFASIPGTATLEVVEYSTPGCGTASAVAAVPVDFFDVPPGHPFHADIVTIAREDITAGCGGGNYCPADPVTRAQMAVFLLKSKNGADWVPSEFGPIFDDVPNGAFACFWINNLWNISVTGGCGGNNYCPDASVTRAQMAVFILKTLGEFYPPQGPQIFDDVPPGSFASNFIDALYNQGITGGCSVIPKLYCPDGIVNRGQMAVFLVRAFLEPAP